VQTCYLKTGKGDIQKYFAHHPWNSVVEQFEKLSNDILKMHNFDEVTYCYRLRNVFSDNVVSNRSISLSPSPPLQPVATIENKKSLPNQHNSLVPTVSQESNTNPNNINNSISTRPSNVSLHIPQKIKIENNPDTVIAQPLKRCRIATNDVTHELSHNLTTTLTIHKANDVNNKSNNNNQPDDKFSKFPLRGVVDIFICNQWKAATVIGKTSKYIKVALHDENSNDNKNRKYGEHLKLHNVSNVILLLDINTGQCEIDQNAPIDNST